MANFIATIYTHTRHGLVATDAQKTPKTSWLDGMLPFELDRINFSHRF